MRTIILTGFKPFADYKDNPVQESTEYFDGRIIGKHAVIGLVLECTYRGAFEVLRRVMNATDPIAVVSTGLASSVRGIRLETESHNEMNGKYADEEGFDPKGEQTISCGRNTEYPNCDIDKIAENLRSRNIPVELSSDAGRFICESLFHLTNHHVRTHSPQVRNIFTHVPWTNEMRPLNLEEGKMTLPTTTLHAALEQILLTIAED